MTAIRDIMSKVVVSIRPDATLMDAVKVLTKHHLSGAPVISTDGKLVGFISEPNLMDVLFDADVRKARVSDFMTTEVQFVRPDESISEAAAIFAMYGIRRLPVVEKGRLVGVLTRRDMLSHALFNPEPLEEPLAELIPGLVEFN
jgi:CBS domain-containing protein